MKAAVKLRENFIDAFDLRDTPECKGLGDHPDHICLFPPDYEPGVGINTPFLVPNFAVFIPNNGKDYSEAVQWFTQRRGELDVLVHPNSGCPVADHLDWAIWQGNKWELKMSF